jgi:hypothetical protein
VNIQNFAYQRVRTQSERTERNFLAQIEVVVGIALRRVLILAVVEVLHDRVLHLLLHIQGLKTNRNNYEIKLFLAEKNLYTQVKEDSPRKQYQLTLQMLHPKSFLKQKHNDECAKKKSALIKEPEKKKH